MTRTLHIEFSNQALEMLGRQNKKIVVVKQSNEALRDGNAAVAWLTTRPFREVKITWEEEFYLYASQTPFQPGAVIQKTCLTDGCVNDKNDLYRFGPECLVFRAESYSQGKAGTIYMKNLVEDGGFTLFGLAQKISCGGGSYVNPINAVESIPGDNIAFTPVEKVRVFLQSDVQDAKVLSTIPSEHLCLDFTGTTEQTIRYDENVNRFF